MTRHSSLKFDDTESGPALQAAANPISVFDIKRIIVLRLPVFLITSAVAAAVLLPAAWFLTPVTYTATAEIRFLSVRPRILDSPDSYGVGFSSYEKFVNTQAALISGNTVLKSVLEDPDVGRVPEIIAAPDSVAFLSEHVRARQKSGTELVSVECTMKDPKAAKLILEAVVKEYMDSVAEIEDETSTKRTKILDEELVIQEQALGLLLDELKNKKSALNIIGSDTRANPELGKMSIYRESLIRAEEDLSSLRVTLENIEAQMARAEDSGSGASASVTNVPSEARIERSVDTDPRVMSLLQELALAKSRYASTVSKYFEGSPQLARAKTEIAALEAQIEETRRFVRQDVARSNRLTMVVRKEALEQEIKEAEDRVAKYNKLMEESELRLDVQSDEFAQLRELEDKIAERRGLIEQYNRQITDLRLEMKAPAQVERATAPSVPLHPSYAKVFASLLLACAASAGLGLMAAAIMELRDSKLRSSRDISRITRFPVIAAIPHLSEARSLDSPESILAAMGDTRSAYADQLRRIFTSVVYPTEESVWVNSILITSPTRGDGKTTVACSLAVALARANRRVLLVDLSHRRPDIEALFNLEPSVGLAEVLNGTHSIEEIVRESGVPNLSIVGPGVDSYGLSDWLVSERMTDFQARAEENFTHVVFDTPPALLMSDASLLAPRVDGVLMVVGVNASTRGMVLRCIDDLDRIGSVILGVVLNGVESMRGGYLKQHFDLHYNYDGSPSTNGRKKAAASSVRPPSPDWAHDSGDHSAALGSQSRRADS